MYVFPGDEEDDDELHEVFVMNMLFLLTNRRSTHLGLPKSVRWQQNGLTNFDDKKFCQMVRVRPEEFHFILNIIKDDKVFHTNVSNQLPTELQLKIVLFRLASSGDSLSIRKVASLFGVGDGGTIQNVTRRVFKAIIRIKRKFLYWPNATERLKLVSKTSNEMPGCIGYIDGCEIKLAEAPIKHQKLFISGKQQFAIKMQVICDYKLRIRQVTTGYPGSVHNSKIFLNCPFAKRPELFLSNSQWIAGDSTYPLKSFLITPFGQNSSEHSREAREQFNKYFSKYSVRIENCFGILKERFGSLKELKFRMLNDRNKKECNDWVVVCCILHNILISFNNEENGDSTDTLQPNIDFTPPTNTRNGLLNFIQNREKINTNSIG